jgi:hypothetical protein
VCALRTVPISLGHNFEGRCEAEHVVSAITRIAQEHLFVILCVATNLALQHGHAYALLGAVPGVFCSCRAWVQARDVVRSLAPTTHYELVCSCFSFFVRFGLCARLEAQMTGRSSLVFLRRIDCRGPFFGEKGLELGRVFGAAHKARDLLEVRSLGVQELLEEAYLLWSPL